MKKPNRKKSDGFPVHSSQEVDAIMRAASDGKLGRNWDTNPQSLVRFHVVPGAAHRVQLELSEEELAAGGTVAALEALTFAQDPDFNFALLYVSRLLAPAMPLPPNTFAGAWIDLDDVMKKIGLDPRTSTQRREMRERVWRYLLFGTRARIVGDRTGRYIQKSTGKDLETYIESPPWAVLEKEKPVQPSLFPEIGAAPLRVRLVASEAWTRLTTSPDTAQYLPMGEVLGAIPGAKPSGAWARVIGLALANFWRRQPRAALDGSIKPTRRELLERYIPATGAVTEILSSNDPRRAIQYWVTALRILVDCDFLENFGEATLTLEQQSMALSRYFWQEEWLDTVVDIRPGAQMQETLAHLSSALPQPRAQNLKQQKKRTENSS